MEESESSLIEQVKKNRCLYDPNDQSYRDRLKRKETWQKIAEDLKIPSTEAKDKWMKLRRQYVNRHRDKNRTLDTSFDNTMSFLEGCYQLENSQNSSNRSVEKPPDPQSSASSSSNGATMTATAANNSSHEQQATASNEPSSSSASDNISSSMPQDAPKDDQHWLDLLFLDLAQKVRKLQNDKQMAIVTKIKQLCEEACDERECSYIS